MPERTLIEDLYNIQAIQFGNFTLKSGLQSPIYFDLRRIISYPAILKQISDMLWKKVHNLHFDVVCGVPYTAIPLATALSIRHDIPMVLKRKEAKEHGLKKMIEGAFSTGQTCLVIEDVVTSGISIEETIACLEQEGLKVQDIGLVLNREQGGKERLEGKGLRIHSLLTLSHILETLLTLGKINQATYEEIKTYANL